MSRIIVTGGAGFIGSRLVDYLVKLGEEVTILDNLSTGKRENLAASIDKIKLVECDLVDWPGLLNKSASFGRTDYLFHLAALPRVGKSIEFPIETHESNTTGTLCALELARRLNVRKFIYTSSSSIYGVQKKLPITEDQVPNPQNPYAVQKLVGELYCACYSKMFDLPIVVFRLFNVYGPGMESEGAYKLIFSTWVEQKKQVVPLTIYGDGEQTRDFTHVSDVVGGLVAGMKYKQKGLYKVFNLGSGKQVTINYLASLFKHKVVHCPPRRHEERFKQADINKAKICLGWEPSVTIEKGVEELLK